MLLQYRMQCSMLSHWQTYWRVLRQLIQLDPNNVQVKLVIISHTIAMINYS